MKMIAEDVFVPVVLEGPNDGRRYFKVLKLLAPFNTFTTWDIIDSNASR